MVKHKKHHSFISYYLNTLKWLYVQSYDTTESSSSITPSAKNHEQDSMNTRTNLSMNENNPETYQPHKDYEHLNANL